MEMLDGIESALSKLNEQGVNQGVASKGPIQQLGNEPWETFLARFRVVLETIERLRPRSKRDRDLFQALYGPLLTQIETPLTQVQNAIQSIVVHDLRQAQNQANQVLSQVQAPLSQINAHLSRLESRLPRALYYLSRKESVADLEERLSDVVSGAEKAVRKIRGLEEKATKDAQRLEQLLPDAEELSERIRSLTEILARDLADDVEVQTLDLVRALELLGERLTAARKTLEERASKSEKLHGELERLVEEAKKMETRASDLLNRSEEVLGHAEGVGLAKWFKQAFEEYERKLEGLRVRFGRAFWATAILTTAYILAVPFLASWLEQKAALLGLDGNVFVSLFGKLVVITPITVGLFYFWRIYNEYATAERLGHRYRHWQALGASLGGFRMLTEGSDLSNEMTAALFRAVIADPLKKIPHR